MGKTFHSVFTYLSSIHFPNMYIFMQTNPTRDKKLSDSLKFVTILWMSLKKRTFWLNNTSIWCLMSLLKYLLNKFFISSHLTQMCNISYSHKNILGKSWCFFFFNSYIHDLSLAWNKLFKRKKKHVVGRDLALQFVFIKHTAGYELSFLFCRWDQLSFLCWVSHSMG